MRNQGVLVVPSGLSSTIPPALVNPGREQNWVPNSSRISASPMECLNAAYYSIEKDS